MTDEAHTEDVEIEITDVDTDTGAVEETDATTPETNDAEAPEPAPPAPPERTYRDPECAELGRHRPNCECAGEMRKPINPR